MIQSFSHKLISWYKSNKRDLPWRNTDDPYKIWISEIILQQTRVKFAIDYYNKFIEKFPTIESLSDAKEDDVLNSWQGLGYYSRARNIHHTSKILKEKYSSNFPNKYDEIIRLKGIGKYTAGAILSFAFKKKFPVVDGNVFRLLSRIFFICFTLVIENTSCAIRIFGLTNHSSILNNCLIKQVWVFFAY